MLSALPYHPQMLFPIHLLSSSRFKMHRNDSLKLVALLLIFLELTYVLSASAIPVTRSQNLQGQDSTLGLPSLAKLEHVIGNGEEVDMDEGLLIERRMDLETQDYGGTGANQDHNPKSPGSV